MKRGLLIKLAIGVFVVLVGSFSTARAHQLYDENQLRQAAASARARLTEQIMRASSAGLSGTDLAAIRTLQRQAAARRAPSASPLWAPEIENFYHDQEAAYRGLSSRLTTDLKRATRQARNYARAALTKASAHIKTAHDLDLNTSTSQTSIQAATSEFDRAASPRAYRKVVQDVGAAVDTLRAATAVRQSYVSHLLARSGTSIDTIANEAQTVASGADNKLSLLSIFTPRGKTEASRLTAALAAVRSQSSARRAAVKTADVQVVVDQISADFGRTVPSKVIVVSTEQQWARMYQDGRQVYDTPVTTGGPELPTDHGVFHIYLKASPFVFHSPWPPGSPYYYNPTPVQYWMPFDGGEGLHDASWRSNFGPGSNVQPTDLGTGNYILGTHGCVNLPFSAAQFVWDWAPIGTTVVVN